MSVSPADRRLAAILAADIAGYSRLMGADEGGTLARLKALRRELIDPAIAAHRGRVVKTTGDGMLVEFPSVVQAVECAVAAQRALADRGAADPAERRIEFRVGINLGDVIVENGDIFGDGVNIAARLESLAAPGGVCLAQAAYEQVRRKVPFAFVDLGPQRLKNIAEPVRVWRWAPEGGAGTDEIVAARAVLARPALAVLPFANLSGDAAQDYFADGITEEIITALARWREFPVIARNSTFTFKNRAVNVIEAARELGARYVLEGSVRRAGNRVRITAQLIDGQSGHHLWAERYDRDLVDIFNLQDEITERVATEIAPAMRLAEMQRVGRKPPDSLDAWDRYLRGLATLWRYTPESSLAALDDLKEAIRLDPGFAAAHGALAAVHVTRAIMLWGDLATEFAQAIVHARQAVELDDGDASAHAMMVFLYIYLRQHELALAAARRAVSLNPALDFAWYTLGQALLWSGRAGEAVDAVDRALALGPHTPYNWNMHVVAAIARYMSGDYEGSHSHARRVCDLMPDWPRGHGYAVAALAQLGRIDEARAEGKRIRERWPDLGVASYAGLPFQPDQLERLVEGLRKAGLAD
jgi:adenylate cyclase